MTRHRIRIGTSGFGIAQKDYFQIFPCVEVQQTFYQTPSLATLQRWRDQAPSGFEFVLKAWQLITHDAKSPTYRRLKKRLSETEKEEAGYFRPTALVREAWAQTRACANVLRARTVLFQCPASFKQTDENIANLGRFFSAARELDHLQAKQDQFNFCWEPRGDWDPHVIEEICEDLNLCHVVDPFTSQTSTPLRIYFRLHGRGGWRYEYDETDLRELASLLPKAGRKSHKGNSPYVFFNNARMTQDAQRFQAIIADNHFGL